MLAQSSPAAFFPRHHRLIRTLALCAAALACALGASAALAQTPAPYGWSADAPQAPIAQSEIPTNPAVISDNGPKTRAQVRAELARLRAAGYDPMDWIHYPENIQEAERRVQIEDSGGVYVAPRVSY